MRALFADRYVCAMWRGHPLARKRRITLADYCGCDHLLIAPSGEPTGLMDRVLARRGLRRRVAVTVNQFLVAPFVLRDTRLILTLLRRIAVRYAEPAALHVVPLPLAVPPVRMTLVWHRRMDGDPAHGWIRGVVADLTAAL
jgi:DNA-binding transcriptional LysR family regulator